MNDYELNRLMRQEARVFQDRFLMLVYRSVLRKAEALHAVRAYWSVEDREKLDQVLPHKPMRGLSMKGAMLLKYVRMLESFIVQGDVYSSELPARHARICKFCNHPNEFSYMIGHIMYLANKIWQDPKYHYESDAGWGITTEFKNRYQETLRKYFSNLAQLYKWLEVMDQLTNNYQDLTDESLCTWETSRFKEAKDDASMQNQVNKRMKNAVEKTDMWRL